jgi:L-alanine-DL-glutamate epimerase-like enolase superfamily enzyme
VRIVALEVLPYALPLVEPLATARGTIAQRTGCVVRLRASDGTIGLGDAAPHPHDTAQDAAKLRAQLKRAAQWLVGADLEQEDPLLDAAGRLGGAVAMGLDVALHDLLARARRVPLVELLGGSRRAVVASALLGADAAGDARRARSAGFVVAKLKAAADPARLAGTVAAVQRAAPGLALRLDVNGAWSVATARDVVASLPARGIDWLEQPVPAQQLDALAEIRGRAHARGLRIAADEAVTGPEAVRRIAAQRAADVVVLKLVQVGGLRAALAAAGVARAAGLDVVVTTGIDSGIGTAAALHLASLLQASAPAGATPPAAGVATGALLARDLVHERLAPRAVMPLPQGAGLGVTLDEGALDVPLRASA